LRYSVELLPAARKSLGKLPANVRERVVAALALLRDKPVPPNARKLKSRFGLYRIRVQSYRIVYRAEHQKLLVLVIRIAHRKDAYR